MADLLIRDLPPEILAGLDASAAQLGISRVEFVRRALAQAIPHHQESVAEIHLSALASLLEDLNNPDVMAAAWQ